jgi:hypothetical protein
LKTALQSAGEASERTSAIIFFGLSGPGASVVNLPQQQKSHARFAHIYASGGYEMGVGTQPFK